jgi:hypothetical protein
MRTRLLPAGAAMALSLGFLTATPAAATYAVESLTYPKTFVAGRLARSP